MTGTMETMTMSDGASVAVYHAQPTGERRGGLVLVQEIFGVTDHIRDLCDEYAADGYEVLAPALFDREHPGFEADYSGDGLARGVELARQLHPFDLSLKDVQTCIDTLAPAGPVFVVGYCYGGSVAWFAVDQADRRRGGERLLRQHDPGRGGRGAEGAGDPPLRSPRPRHPDGGRRAGASPRIGRTRRCMSTRPGHGFNSDRRKDYHEPSADLAKQRTLDLFRANGG